MFRLIFSIFLISPFFGAPAMAENHRIEMLNTAPSDTNHNNVFSPALLFVEPGDTMTFVPTDAGHNSASKRGMLPEGAEPWNSPMDEEFTIELKGARNLRLCMCTTL